MLGVWEMSDDFKALVLILCAAAFLIGIPIVMVEGCYISHKYTPTFICERCGKWVWSK